MESWCVPVLLPRHYIPDESQGVEVLGPLQRILEDTRLCFVDYPRLSVYGGHWCVMNFLAIVTAKVDWYSSRNGLCFHGSWPFHCCDTPLRADLLVSDLGAERGGHLHDITPPAILQIQGQDRFRGDTECAIQ